MNDQDAVPYILIAFENSVSFVHRVSIFSLRLTHPDIFEIACQDDFLEEVPSCISFYSVSHLCMNLVFVSADQYSGCFDSRFVST